MDLKEERRHYNRINNQFNVRIARELKDNEFKDMAIDVAKSVNISATGMLLNIKEPLEIKEIVRITFLKPNTFEFFESLARIVRIEENGDSTYKVGLNFFNLSTVEIKQLDYYLSMCGND